MLTSLHRCAVLVRRTAGRLARALGGWVSRWAMPVIAAACSRADAPAPVEAVTPVPVEVSVAPTPVDAGVDAPERNYGDYQLTMYFVTHEEEVSPKIAPANDNAAIGDAELVATLPDLVPLYDRQCETLANVSRAFASQLALQGTGRLRDGRVLNVAGRCDCPRKPCFHVLPEQHKWGMGGSGMPLEPFRTVAVDPRRIKLGSLLYLPELDGMRMPGPPGVGGFIHDGCVVAGDTGGGIKGKQLDLFVGRRAYYRGLARRGSHAWASTTEVRDGTARCQRIGGKVTRSVAGSI
jgi:3D (Asp-Asp-Asp) domain-containing protein